MTSKAKQRREEQARRAQRIAQRKREQTAFYCKAPHPNASWAERGRLCSFQIFPHRVAKDTLAACPRCDRVHRFDGVSWTLLT